MTRRFPKLLTHVGWFIAIPSLILGLRLAWEQTVWTWDSGPQMVGFSLLHTGLGIPLYLALLLGLIWVTAVLVFAGLCRSLGGKITIGLVAVYALAWGLIAIPYGHWQRLFVGKLAKGPHAAEFMMSAAAVGDLETVDAFMSQGVSVNARDRSGATPLHAAAVGGQTAVAEFLLAKGADVNAINKYGDSPLENAFSMKHDATAKFIAVKGGKRIRGTEEQRQKASTEIVREQMEEMDRRRSR
jgi:ankyrin repeat protein